MIDVHILSFPQDRASPRYKQALDAMLSHPVNIIEAPAIEGDVRLARKNAYSMGTADYVSYVDWDDDVQPGAYQTCLDAMHQEPKLVGVNTHQLVNGVLQAPPEKHASRASTFIRFGFTHVFVVKRDIMTRVMNEHYHLLPPIWGQDRCIVSLCALYGDWLTLPIVGYHYHQSGSGVASTQHKRHGLKKFRSNIAPTHQFIHRQLQARCHDPSLDRK